MEQATLYYGTMITVLKFLVMAIAALAEKAFLTDFHEEQDEGEAGARKLEFPGSGGEVRTAKSEINGARYGWSSRMH